MKRNSNRDHWIASFAIRTNQIIPVSIEPFTSKCRTMHLELNTGTIGGKIKKEMSKVY